MHTDLTIRNPELVEGWQRAAQWIRDTSLGRNGAPVPVIISLPGGQFRAVKYYQHGGTASLYIPAYYGIFRRAVHPTSRAGQKRKHLRVAFTARDQTWYMAYHGPTHRDGQPMIAIPPDMAHIYPFGPTVGLAQWAASEEIDRYEAKPYERIAFEITEVAL